MKRTLLKYKLDWWQKSLSLNIKFLHYVFQLSISKKPLPIHSSLTSFMLLVIYFRLFQKTVCSFFHLWQNPLISSLISQSLFHVSSVSAVCWGLLSRGLLSRGLLSEGDCLGPGVIVGRCVIVLSAKSTCNQRSHFLLLITVVLLLPHRLELLDLSSSKKISRCFDPEKETIVGSLLLLFWFLRN